MTANRTRTLAFEVMTLLLRETLARWTYSLSAGMAAAFIGHARRGIAAGFIDRVADAAPSRQICGDSFRDSERF